MAACMCNNAKANYTTRDVHLTTMQSQAQIRIRMSTHIHLTAPGQNVLACALTAAEGGHSMYIVCTCTHVSCCPMFDVSEYVREAFLIRC